jgi:predicted nucleic acid-binding protein
MKIFLDANIFVAACGSATGGSRYLFSIADVTPAWQLLTSDLALREARRNIAHKMPECASVFSDLVIAHALTVVHDPPEALVAWASGVVNKKDAPILAAALSAKADVLCTLDRKDFHGASVKRACRAVGMGIVTPKDLLVEWRMNSVG